MRFSQLFMREAPNQQEKDESSFARISFLAADGGANFMLLSKSPLLLLRKLIE